MWKSIETAYSFRKGPDNPKTTSEPTDDKDAYVFMWVHDLGPPTLTRVGGVEKDRLHGRVDGQMIQTVKTYEH